MFAVIDHNTQTDVLSEYRFFDWSDAYDMYCDLINNYILTFNIKTPVEEHKYSDYEIKSIVGVNEIFITKR